MNNESMVSLREYAALYRKCEALTVENSRLRDRLRRERDSHERIRRMAWDIIACDDECGTGGCHGCR